MAKEMHKGFSISNPTKNVFVLTYEAGIVGEEGASIVIAKDTYEFISNTDLPLKELFVRFDLAKCRVLYKIGPTVQPSAETTVNTPDKYHGKGYYITRENGKYFLSYMLSRHGGGTGRFEVSREVFEQAQDSDMPLDRIFETFDLYRFDVPENYID